MMFVRHGPFWFRFVTMVLIVWGFAGCYACFQQFRLGAEAMGPASAYDRALYAALPAWYDWVYAVAVGAGLIGAALLYMRKGAARMVFVVSLIAILVQFGWLFATTDIVAHKGPAVTLPFPAVIVGVTLFALWLTGHARANGWVR